MTRTPQAAPDRMALEIAHRKLRSDRTLDEMLAVPSLKRILEAVARRHMKKRLQLDVKMLQAGDDK